MAIQTTPDKTFRCASRKRMTTQDAEDFTRMASLLDENAQWTMLADYALTVYGWNVTHSVDREFSVAVGAGVIEGVLAKSVLAQGVILDDNALGGAVRIDLIELLPRAAPANPLPACLSETASDPATEVTLGAIARTQVAAEAVANGDGATLAFDLDHDGVDGRTLNVQVAATPVGGWNLSFGTGGAGVDQIIFGVAPAFGDAITADYYYQAGGTETAAAQNTRYTRSLSFHVVKGTPGLGVPLWTVGAIKIAQIDLVDGWVGGAAGTTISNAVKEFMVHADQSIDTESAGVAPYSGKMITPIRNMDFVVHGLRLVCDHTATDQLIVTPGWVSIGGVSAVVSAPLSYTLPALAATGWYYVYGVIAATSSTQLPGAELSLEVDQTPPDSYRGLPASVGRVYLGAINVTSNAPNTIQPFFTKGNWTFWKDPTAVTFPGAPIPATGDLDVSEWCPDTGRLINVYLDISHTEDAVGGVDSFTSLQILSHLLATGFPYPCMAVTVWVTALTVAFHGYAQGVVIAEESAGTRSINYVHTQRTTSIAAEGYTILVLGYQDDYRTMDETGATSLY